MSKNTTGPKVDPIAQLREIALEQLCFPPGGEAGPNLEKLMTGSKEVSLDDKGRFYIPTRFRDLLGDGGPLHIVIPPGFSGVWIFAESEFNGLMNTAIDNARGATRKPGGLETVKLLLNRSERVTPDNAHRIQLSNEILFESGLERGGRANIVGSGNFLEIEPLPQSKK